VLKCVFDGARAVYAGVRRCEKASALPPFLPPAPTRVVEPALLRPGKVFGVFGFWLTWQAIGADNRSEEQRPAAEASVTGR